MKNALEKGYSPLYVKSFNSRISTPHITLFPTANVQRSTGWAGEEVAINQVFEKARAESPCLLILEDLDSLINDANRSFFLNQLDGLENNDGLLVIGTTNHFEWLDPAITKRPSRFDRKLFVCFHHSPCNWTLTQLKPI
jgi:transitional endoplasmic reticulum ATPase